jgi:hypothetical protein
MEELLEIVYEINMEDIVDKKIQVNLSENDFEKSSI